MLTTHVPFKDMRRSISNNYVYPTQSMLEQIKRTWSKITGDVVLRSCKRSRYIDVHCNAE